MRLSELGEAVQARIVRGGGDPEIASLAYDSRRVGPGTLFFCVPGERSDGHEFAPAALEAGAAAVVAERELTLDLPQALVADARAAMAPIAAHFWGEPTSRLRVAGITGTNGKTTTAFLLRGILEAAGRSCGLLGTVKQVVGRVAEDVVRTTPEAIDLQATFARMLAAGDSDCAMEVSSHALVLHRCDAIAFDVALFTNLTQDHLDFHHGMEDYFAAKRILFEMDAGARIVNADDPYGQRLASELDCLTFSAAGKDADYRAVNVNFDETGSRFEAHTPDGRIDVSISLPGHFNVANALAAIAAAAAMGVGIEAAAAALAEAPHVPGRFERIDAGQAFTVLVDYAHTPDSLDNVLAAARKLTRGRLISVFGAGGDRDREKRPLMGRIATEHSDLAIVTSDNPRSEEPEAIIAEILAGIPEDSEARVEPDRRSAIAIALGLAAPGDTVLIAGKGHEQGQEFEDGRKLPFDDREVALEALAGIHPPAVDARESKDFG